MYEFGVGVWFVRKSIECRKRGISECLICLQAGQSSGKRRRQRNGGITSTDLPAGFGRGASNDDRALVWWLQDREYALRGGDDDGASEGLRDASAVRPPW